MRRLLVTALLAWSVAAAAVAQMPDPRQMSGIPRPVDDLPAGAVSVRVIRGSMTNNLVGQPVQLTVDGVVQTATTDAQGRAEFLRIRPGATVQAGASVDGESLTSQTFQAPASGGVRLLLVATDGGAASAEPTAPAVPGTVVLGGETRVILEPGEDGLSVFYILEIVNTAATPVQPPSPFVLTLPDAALGTNVIPGSSPLATASGRTVTVRGPFPPGMTAVQVAATFPITGGRVSIAQAFPADLNELAVISKRVGTMRLTSPQLAQVQDANADGTPVVFGSGGGVRAGQPVTLTIDGLPYASDRPRNVALALVVLVVAGGVWAAVSGGASDDDGESLARLQARRDALLAQLAALERQQPRGSGLSLAAYQGRRESLVAALEPIYSALDERTSTAAGSPSPVAGA